MPEWRNAYALVLETSSFGSESSSLSSGTKVFDVQRVPVNGRRAVSKTVDW
jgi:hypothetical protein